MQPDQPAQGSTADYCSRWPGEPHAISTHMRNGIAVRRCDSCGWIDFDDLRAQQHTAYERGLAEGRRQATEGWEREWGIGLRIGYVDVPWVSRASSEAAARDWATREHVPLVSRLVGPWEPAEHAFDESSVVNPATGEPYRGSSGPEPYEPPDPLCVCGASWLGDEGCLTQQSGWTPPPPYDGPSIEEPLPAREPAEQPEGGAL